jgi:hypothetical protein
MFVSQSLEFFFLEIFGVAAIANKTEWFSFLISAFFFYGQYINSLGNLSGMSKKQNPVQ